MNKTKIQKILVALDGSKHSKKGLDMAIVLARQYNTKVTGIHVINNISKEFLEKKGLEPQLLAYAETIMEEARIRSAKNGIDFEENIFFGNAGPRIVKFAEERNYNIIIIGARGMSKIKEIFLGSVSNHVSNKSKIPVLIVK